jgi:xylulokinase
MAAMLNGATCVDWAARLLGDGNVGALIDRVEAADRGPSPVIFLPYLSGERTPHNDASARGAFAGLDLATDAVDLAQAVLEGVAFSLADGQRVVGEVSKTAPIPLVGGGARSPFWITLIASILGRSIQRVAAADKGPAFGAARLARLAVTGEAPAAVCTKAEVVETIDPDADLQRSYRERIAVYRRLYPALKGRFV